MNSIELFMFLFLNIFAVHCSTSKKGGRNPAVGSTHQTLRCINNTKNQLMEEELAV